MRRRFCVSIERTAPISKLKLTTPLTLARLYATTTLGCESHCTLPLQADLLVAGTSLWRVAAGSPPHL